MSRAIHDHAHFVQGVALPDRHTKRVNTIEPTPTITETRSGGGMIKNSFLLHYAPLVNRVNFFQPPI